MSYDLFTFRLPPGADPGDYATEVVESHGEDGPANPSDPTVAQLAAAFRSVFPGAEVVEEDEENAMVLLEERLVSVDLWPSHSEICISYGVEKDERWIATLLTDVARAAAEGGHDTLFDAQLDRPVLPAVPADAAAIGEAYSEGLGIVAGIRAEHEAEQRDEAGGGFFRRLFGRR